MTLRQLLVTGFGSFDDVVFNPSGAIARALAEAPPENTVLHTQQTTIIRAWLVAWGSAG